MEKIPAADLLAKLRSAGAERPAELPHKLAPATETEAYRIQLQVLELLAARVAGWKSTLLDTANGMSAPIAGGNLLHSPAHITDLAQPTHGARLGIEPEIAFRMLQPLPPLPGGREYTRAAVLAAIGSAHAALELCACRVGDFKSPLQLGKLADAISNDGLVLGAALESWRDLDLSQLPLTLQVNGSVAHRGVGGHPVGDPLAPVVWLANHLSARGIGLRAGAVITTGSCAGLHLLAPGQRVRAEFAGLGAVTLQA
jgi:2-keto-4-pentenoate hydratase